MGCGLEGGSVLLQRVWEESEGKGSGKNLNIKRACRQGPEELDATTNWKTR